MLRSLTAKQFLDWQAFESLEPFGEKAADLRIASVVQALYNVNRDPTKGAPITLLQVYTSFLKELEELSTPKKRTQTWQQQKAIAQAIAAAYNSAGKQNTHT